MSNRGVPLYEIYLANRSEQEKAQSNNQLNNIQEVPEEVLDSDRISDRQYDKAKAKFQEDVERKEALKKEKKEFKEHVKHSLILIKIKCLEQNKNIEPKKLRAILQKHKDNFYSEEYTK